MSFRGAVRLHASAHFPLSKALLFTGHRSPPGIVVYRPADTTKFIATLLPFWAFAMALSICGFAFLKLRRGHWL
jgi:hypothetical protein